MSRDTSPAGSFSTLVREQLQPADDLRAQVWLRMVSGSTRAAAEREPISNDRSQADRAAATA